MSKGLEALEMLKNDECILLSQFDECYSAIERELKALEIIKKYVGIQEYYDDIFFYQILDKQYYSNRSELIISQEEYSFLKEVLS